MQDTQAPSPAAINTGEDLLQYVGALETALGIDRDDKAALRKWVKDAVAASAAEKARREGEQKAPTKKN